MSVINKMLQDLDARGSAPGEAMQPDIRPVAANDSKPGMAVVGGAVALLLLAGAGAGLWWMNKKPAPAPAPAPAPLVATVTNVERRAPLVAAAVAPAIAEPVDEPAAVIPAKAGIQNTSEHRRNGFPPARERRANLAPQVQQPKVRAAPPQQPAAEPTGRHMTAQQRAETEYRRALAGLQEGRVHESIAALERALAIDPRHDSARQTLVGLL
ncbi:MAG: hypothetical protein ACXW2U_05690, partial [Telluria sp.]